MIYRAAAAILLALALAAPAAGGDAAPCPCAGDCNRDGRVTVSEVVTLVNIVLGNQSLSACDCLDCGGAGEVCIDPRPWDPIKHFFEGCPR